MPECKKCGYKTNDEISFCPRCGAAIKVEQPPAEQRPAPITYRRDEKAEKYEKKEKREKQEKKEKGEKREKGEYAFLGPLIGGIVLIIIGIISYLTITDVIPERTKGILGAFFVIVIGVAIILGALYFLSIARKRNPTP